MLRALLARHISPTACGRLLPRSRPASGDGTARQLDVKRPTRTSQNLLDGRQETGCRQYGQVDSAHPIVVLVRERGILVSAWPVIRQEWQSGIGKVERFALLQLRVFRLRLLIDRNVRIRILPEGEEVFVEGEGAGAGRVRAGQGLRLQRIRPRHTQLRPALTNTATLYDQVKPIYARFNSRFARMGICSVSTSTSSARSARARWQSHPVWYVYSMNGSPNWAAQGRARSQALGACWGAV